MGFHEKCGLHQICSQYIYSYMISSEAIYIQTALFNFCSILRVSSRWVSWAQVYPINGFNLLLVLTLRNKFVLKVQLCSLKWKASFIAPQVAWCHMDCLILILHWLEERACCILPHCHWLGPCNHQFDIIISTAIYFQLTTVIENFHKLNLNWLLG